MTTAPIISIRNVSKHFGALKALDNVSIDIKPGEFFALLGPSGCGKSTLLRAIAGFEPPTQGQILLDGEDMTDTAPNRRPINMVFQSYAVFPHMSVAKNVAYGLMLAKVPRDEQEERVTDALKQVHLEAFRDRMPDQLSGGQRQRVALARALVNKPRVLLLDEPLSALDAKLRDAMRSELVKLQHTVGVSFIMVTHDQSEALAMADRIAILDKGRLRQIATPEELYNNPADAFVADFIGRINLFNIDNVQRDDSDLMVSTSTFDEVRLKGVAQPSGPAKLAIRPEKITLSAQKPEAGGITCAGRVGDIAFQGESSLVEVTLDDGFALNVFLTADKAQALSEVHAGSAIWAHWLAEDMLLLPNTAR